MSDALSVALAAGHVRAARTVSLETTHGTYYFATEPLSWSGLFFLPRLIAVGALVTEAAGPAEGLVGVARTTIRLANADGWCTRMPAEFFRGRLATVRDLLLDVTSTPLRSWTFRMTGLRMLSPEEVELGCEDQWADVRRQLLPSAQVVIDTTKFPSLREGSPAIGQVVPLVYGRCRVPLQLVDDTVNDTLWTACIGSAGLASGGKVTELFNDQHSPVESAALEYGIIDGTVPATFVRIRSPIYFQGRPTPHFADLEGPVGGRPDRVLLDWFTGPGGVGYSGTVVTSDSLLTAQTFYETHSLGFDGIISEQRPLEAWLGEWSRDSLTRVLLRDQLVLQPQRSLAPVSSFTTASILFRTATVEDAPVRELPTITDLTFPDRTTGLPLTAHYTAASGGTVAQFTSTLLGTPGAAQRVARFYAVQALLGARGYQLGTSIRASSLDPGDLVTLTHSDMGPTQTCVVAGLSRDGWRIDATLRQSSAGLYDITTGALPLQPDPPFALTFQFVRFVAGATPTSYQLVTGADSTVTVSMFHALNAQPLYAGARWQRAGEPAVASLTTGNNSVAVVRVEGFTGLSTVPLPFERELLGFELRA